MDGDRQLPATQHQLIETNSAPTPGSKPWSTGLGKLLLLDSGDGTSDRRASAVNLIIMNPKLRAEAQRLSPVLERLQAPATRDEITSTVMREMPAWGVSTKAAGEWGVTYASYADAMEGLPLYAIEEGIIRWNRGEGMATLAMGGFPPRPAQLYLLANEGLRELRMAAYRCKLALGEATAPRVEKDRPKVTEDERKKIGEDFRRLAATLGVTGPKTAAPIRPGTSPQQMAEHLRRRADEVGDVI